MMDLKWNAVDFVNDTLTIRHTVVMQNKIVANERNIRVVGSYGYRDNNKHLRSFKS